MGIDSKTLMEVFKFAPAVLALLAVIYLMYKIIIKKDETISKLVDSSKMDIARESKMITLLEILVSRSGAERGKE
jgi:hypothetical protein